jgi:hypothetical protein
VLNDQDKENLDANLCCEEVYKAVCGKQKRRARDVDNLTAEAWEMIFPIIGRVIRMNQTYGELGTMINENIHLIGSIIEDQ